MHVMVCQPAGCDSVNVSPLHPLPGGILEKLKKLVKKLVPNAITLELKLFVSDQMPWRSRDMPFE